MIVLGVWLVLSITTGLLWAWWNRERPEPNQWSRYRGVMHLREHVDAAPPMDTAELAQHMRRDVIVSSAGVYLMWPPVQCVACKRMAAFVRRGVDGARCSSCQ